MEVSAVRGCCSERGCAEIRPSVELSQDVEEDEDDKGHELNEEKLAMLLEREWNAYKQCFRDDVLPTDVGRGAVGVARNFNGPCHELCKPDDPLIETQGEACLQRRNQVSMGESIEASAFWGSPKAPSTMWASQR